MAFKLPVSLAAKALAIAALTGGGTSASAPQPGTPVAVALAARHPATTAARTPPPRRLAAADPVQLPGLAAAPPGTPLPAYRAPSAAAEVEAWRDQPLTPGSWSWRRTADGSAASFAAPGAGTLVELRCRPGQAPGAGLVTLTRAAPGPSSADPVPLTLVTTSLVRPLSATVQPGWLAASFAAQDRALDAIAFSRGRFAIEAAGLPTVIVPAWEEVGRVVEDCR